MNISIPKMQSYLEWLKTKIFMDQIANKAKKRIVKRGEVYRCNLGQGIGSEECKERPCVILQRDAANQTSSNTIVAPITHSGSTLPIVIPIKEQRDANSGEIILDGNVLLGNIVTISKARLGDYVTELEPDEMKKIDEAIAISIDIKHHYDKLRNIHNDKLVYIDKLKNKIEDLQTSLSDERQIIQSFDELRIDLGFEDFDEMKEYIRSNVLKKSTEEN